MGEHLPVMLEEATAFLKPKPGGIYLDATLGYGGHSSRILTLMKGEGKLIGIDRDGETLKAASERLAKFGAAFLPVHSRFGRIKEILKELGIEALDGLLADFGLNSAQLDDPERGFTFKSGGPLDMRMDRSEPMTLGDFLSSTNNWELAEIFRKYGEMRDAKRVAEAVLREYRAGTIQNSSQLAAVVQKVSGRKGRSLPPATLAFMALRIALNGELEEISKLLEAVPSALKEGGVAVFISFHSLEDRMVKEWAAKRCRAPIPLRGLTEVPGAEKPIFEDISRGAVKPSAEEIKTNPRAASARLRAVRKIESRKGAQV